MKKHCQRKRRDRRLAVTSFVKSKSRVFETLEGKALLAADSSIGAYQNPYIAGDVNGDFRVTPVDVLKIVDALNRQAQGTGSTGQSSSNSMGPTIPSLTNRGNSQFLDVTGDGRVSPQDVLMVVDIINQGILAANDPDKMDLRVKIYDMADNEITEIVVGTDFKIGLYAEDIREPFAYDHDDNPNTAPINVPYGVLAAYADVQIGNTALANFYAGPLPGAVPTLQFSPEYTNSRTGQIDPSTGEVHHAGAINSQLFLDPTDPSQRPDSPGATIWTTVLHANAAGGINFTTSMSDDPNFDELLVYVANDSSQSATPTFNTTPFTIVNEVASELNISDVLLSPEGNAGSTDATFTVTLSAPSTRDIYVTYTTLDGTAMAGSDYQTRTGTLTFLAGDTSETISVPVLGDETFEQDETFQVQLLFASNAIIDDGVGQATIIDDEAPVILAINDQQLVEGNAGSLNMVFTVSLTPASNGPVFVNYATQDGTATAGLDYTAQSGTLTFAVGETTKQIVVPILGDTLNEGFETFSVILSNEVQADLGKATGTGLIIDNDGQGFSISDASVTEGDAGTVVATFTVSLSSDLPVDSSVVYSTSDGTATAGNNDYQPTSGTLTFAAGETSKTLTVLVNGDTLIELDENFFVNLTGAVNSEVVDPSGEGTIVNDEASPTLTIANATGPEGTLLGFTVTLSAPSTVFVTVPFTTATDVGITAATPGFDFTPTLGVLTFAPGQTSRTINVATVADADDLEADETFLVQLGVPTNAVIADGEGRGTILSGNALPLIVVSNAQATEADSGTTNMTFTVSLSGTSASVVTVGYATQNNSATAPADYTAQSGQVTFQPGETTKQIIVPIVGDNLTEGTETFFLNLSSSSNAVIADSQGVGTIIDDDQQGFSISDGSVLEGDAGTTNLVFTVTLSNPMATPATVAFNTANGTATAANNDYVPTSGTLTFAPGETSKTISVQVVGDTAVEDNETFSVVLSGAPVGFELIDSTATGTIFDDDGVHPVMLNFRFEVLDASNQVIPNGGALDVGDTFTLNVYVEDLRSVPQGVLAAYLDIEYIAAIFGVTGPINFAPMYSQGKTGSTNVDGLIDEAGAFADPQGQFPAGETLLFSVPMVAEGSGVGTINGDPADNSFSDIVLFPGTEVPPNQVNYGSFTLNVGANSFQVDSVSQVEGHAGTTNFVFTVTRFNPDPNTATVQFATSNGTATVADSDYLATSGTLTFAPGETQKTVIVRVNGDTKFEADETFSLILSNSSGASIGISTGTGTIQNDDPIPPPAGIRGFVYVDANINGVKDTGEVGLAGVVVTLTSQDGTITMTDITDSTGAYGFELLPAGQYFITETQPGFYADGAESPASFVFSNDVFFVDLNATQNVPNLNFGEKGVLPQFLAAAMNRRVFFSTNLNDPANGMSSPIVDANLSKGDIWVAFDSGWDGLRKFQGFYNDGSVTLKLYDFNFRGDLRLLATSKLVNGIQQFEWIDALETPAKPLFLQISGTSKNASVKIIDTIRAEAQIVEGNSGISNETITFKLSGPQTTDVTFVYSTAGGTAIANALQTPTSDYSPISGTVTIAAGQTSAQITVPIHGDLLDEDDETFNINFTNLSSFVEVAPGGDAVKIVDNDQLARVSISDISVDEGNSGPTNAIFNVTLSSPSGREVTVAFTTVAGSATVNADFAPVTGTITFAPGIISQLLQVPVLGDTFLEGNETFSVVLGSPVNAAILDGVGVGTIRNDDGGPMFLLSSFESSEDVLSSNESSTSSSSSYSATSQPTNSNTAPQQTSQTPDLNGMSRRTSSQRRSSAVDEALANEEDWSLVA